MTDVSGTRRVIPHGTLVRDHVLCRERRRRTSYPVHVVRLGAGDGRIYWFGDCGRLMSCSAKAVNLSAAAGRHCPRRGGRG